VDVSEPLVPSRTLTPTSALALSSSLPRVQGSLEIINSVASAGTDPCYLSVSSNGKYLAVANYGSGTVSLIPVKYACR
jgi:6-phosphogluconolactonase (cycloisomerase 2 family)